MLAMNSFTGAPTCPSTIIQQQNHSPVALGGALSEFATHSLVDLDNAVLMNRVDTKFLVPLSTLPILVAELPHSYSMLQIGGNTCFKYESTYFDTDDYLFYQMHHRGKLNRHKVRVRNYVDSDISFLEVKFKNNKKRTMKQRVGLDSSAGRDLRLHQNFLHRLNVPHAHSLLPSLKNSYHRIALASEERGERLTIDFNLSNQALHDGDRSQHFENVAIIELKQARIDRRSPFFTLVRRLGIRPTSFSKYCLGMAFTHSSNTIKYNRFKPIIRRLEHLTQHSKTDFSLCSV